MTAEMVVERPPHTKPGMRIAWQAGATERCGTVWSVAHAGRSLWAIPDGPYGSRKPVLVFWRGPGGAGFYEQSLGGPADDPAYGRLPAGRSATTVSLCLATPSRPGAIALKLSASI